MDRWSFIKSLINGTEIDFKSREIDWEDLLNYLLETRLLAVIYELIEKQIPSKYFYAYNEEYTKCMIKIDKQFEYSEMLTNILKKQKFVFMKGFCLSNYIYKDYRKRISGDIDIFCDEKNIVSICKIIDSLGNKERYIKKLSEEVEINDSDKEMYYLGDIEKVYYINEEIGVEIKTSANGINNHDIKRLVDKSVYMIINRTEFPVLNNKDMFLRFVDNIGENTNLNRALFFTWQIRDIVDFYFCIKNNFDELISYNYFEIDRRIYLRLTKMLYFTYLLIDAELVQRFCFCTDIRRQDLKFDDVTIDLEKYDLFKLFNDKLYLKKTFIKYRKKMILKREKENVLDAKIINHFTNFSTGNVWFSDIPWMHPIVVNNLKISSTYGINYDRNYLYYNLSISPANMTYMFRLRFMDVNLNCDKFFYDIKIIVNENTIKIFDKNPYFEDDDIKLYLRNKDELLKLTFGIKKKDAITIFNKMDNTEICFLSCFGYIIKKEEIFFSKNINYDDFIKVIMDCY